MTESTRTETATLRSFPPVDEQLKILLRGVDYGDPQTLETMSEALRKRLTWSRETGTPLRAYVGIDPTGTELTLGHTVPLRKLRQLQDLGHEGVFVIGDMTARVGDPSDKDAARQMQSEAEVRANAKQYVEQALRVLDPERTTVRSNSEWLAGLGLAEVIELGSHFTVSQFLHRENFAARFERGDAIWLHEFFYALMQAYDAKALETDIQIGGTEQLFNLMAGRKLQEAAGQRPQIPLTLPILVGTDGHMRMSKTTGNYVAIAERPQEQYGKTMSIPDEAMANWFNLVTDMHPDEIAGLLAQVEAGELHPMEAKKRLAREIVTLYHGPAAAEEAEAHFERTVQGGEDPEAMPVFRLTKPTRILDVMAEADLVPSKSQARRLIEQGGVRIDGEQVEDMGLLLEPGTAGVLQVGKRRFLRLTE